jgi:secretion/DNA translocation related CpaE-like protein
MSDPNGAPLVLTADPALRTELVRLAAAAGVAPNCAANLDLALPSWSSASLVLIGADRVEEVASIDPVRRPQVFVVTAGAASDALYRPALACGADEVLTLPQTESVIIDLFADSGDGAGLHGVLVGVLGGAGGVGSTCFAVALAETLSDRCPTLLVDADESGAGIDRVLGLDEANGVRWDALARSSGRLSSRSLRDALPRRGDLSVLTWPVDRSIGLTPHTVREVLSAARRGYPAVVVDLPRRADASTEEILHRCDLVLLVSTTTVQAAASAVRASVRLPRASSQVVLRRRGGGGAADLAALLGLPVLATMGDQRGLDESIGLGLGPLRSRRGPLARAAATAADLVQAVR